MIWVAEFVIEEGLWADWLREEGGGKIWHLDWIQTPVPGPVSPLWAAPSCTHDSAGAASSSPIWAAGVLLGVRGMHSPYSELHCQQTQPHAGYGEGQLDSRMYWTVGG